MKCCVLSIDKSDICQTFELELNLEKKIAYQFNEYGTV